MLIMLLDDNIESIDKSALSLYIYLHFIGEGWCQKLVCMIRRKLYVICKQYLADVKYHKENSILLRLTGKGNANILFNEIKLIYIYLFFICKYFKGIN